MKISLCFHSCGLVVMKSVFTYTMAPRYNEDPVITNKREVNRGMQIRRSVLFFRQIRRSAKIFVQIRNRNHIRKQNCKGLKVNWYI